MRPEVQWVLESITSAAAFVANDRAILTELIADDVIWHTDEHQADVPSEFRGRDAFFAVRQKMQMCGNTIVESGMNV